MNLLIRLILLTLVTFAVAFVPIGLVNARNVPPCGTGSGCAPTPVPSCNGCVTINPPFGAGVTLQTLISDIINRITVIFFFIVGIVLTAYFIYGGYLYMIDGGNEESAKKAKKVMTSAVIGGAIIGFAATIALLMQTLLGINLGF